ncbi:hypothetical protein [Bradyrhizobium zhanjiangense]|uniref:hypothetical protein n=1 Tax=Bradyrhizobium zhanjiangense TaxID=1325107 RepID=UPI001008EF5C|nr:hypothetical protein [Bradyrhizobium zhanjiangense]
MPKNDYDDPELPFPRLEARIRLLDSETYWLQVWFHKEPGAPREVLANGKRAGNAWDAHEHLRKLKALTSARCDPDDITNAEISN